MVETKFSAEQWRGIEMDMNPKTVAEVADTLGAMSDEIVVFCSAMSASTAFRVKRDLQCEVVLVPTEILRHPDIWAVKHNDRTIWVHAE